jgi:hypothetical protein
MDGQRHKSSFGRSRRRKSRSAAQAPAIELVRIAARRPNSPLLGKAPPRTIAASAVPRHHGDAPELPNVDVEEVSSVKASPEPQRRAARIVQAGAGASDDRERERQKLLRRLMECEGRGSITRAADEFLGHGFELPDQQEVHLQLLEHFDESRARDSLIAMARLLDDESPLKKPVLDQRLRRLEEHADESATRELAADLRRTLRA